MQSFENDHNCNCSDYTGSLPQISPLFEGMYAHENKMLISDSQSEDYTAKKHVRKNFSNIHKSKYYQRKVIMVQQMLRIDQIHAKIQKVKAFQAKAMQILQQKKQMVMNQKMKAVKKNQMALVEKKEAQNLNIEVVESEKQQPDVHDLLWEVKNICQTIKRTSVEVCH